MSIIQPPYSKLPGVGTTIFTVMSQMASEYGAINLSQGFPTFDPPEALTRRLQHHVSAGANQYAPMAGVMVLREKLAVKAEELYGRKYNPETEITVTSGATEALFSAISSVVRPGDEVILIEPAYDSYEPVIRLNGGVPVRYALKGPEFEIKWHELEKHFTDRTRLVIVNTPNNPLGKVLTSSDFDQLAGLVRNRNIFIVSDEVYEHIVFDGRNHLSLMQHPELAERTFVIGSFGKTYHITGWKVGYCYAPAPLTAEFRKVHQFITFSVPTPFQFALADVLEDRDYYESLAAFYQDKRDYFSTFLTAAGLNFLRSEGTFFQNVSFSGFSDESDVELANRLIREVGVASIPVSAFYSSDYNKQDKLLRFCFAKDNDTIARAGERLQKIEW